MKHLLTRALVLAAAAAFAASAPAADKVRVGKAVPFAWTFTPIEVGIEIGIFAKHGLELQVVSFAGDARLQQASSPTASISASAAGPEWPSQPRARPPRRSPPWRARR